MAETGAELFHGTHFTLPWLPLQPGVMTLHDLSPWRDPRWQAGATFVRRRAPYLIRLGLATRIITPTEAVRREAMSQFGIHPDRIRAIPHAAAPHFRPTTSRPGRRPYFLFVGVNEPRKNLSMLLSAWREVYRRLGAELLLAGPRRNDGTVIASEPGLHVLGEVPEPDLPALYSGALACLYPSLYEGFGLPVLEAMQCGALVIASRDAAVAEVAGEAALLLDAANAAAWIEAMCAAAAGSGNLPALRERAVRRAACFSWERTARLTRQVYSEALSKFGG
jgi:alpha-1,3-rhamnosyl/mannosyltransferase